MKAKVERGKGFRGALNYAFGKGEGYIVGGNMAGTSPRDLSSEFAISRKLRPDVGRPVWHTALSLPPGERLSDAEWSVVIDDFMARMGFADHQYVAVRHSDTDKDHVHIVASRIALDGSLYQGRYEALNAIKLTQELELKHGLTITKGLEDGPSPIATPSKNEMEKAIRTGEAPPRVSLQQIVDAALSQPSSVFDFMDRLEAAGVEVKANVASTGKMNGFSFKYGGVPFKASDLGKSYGWKALQERGVEYVQDRDGAALIDRANRAGGAGGQIDDGSAGALDRDVGSVGGQSIASDRGLPSGNLVADRQSDQVVGSSRGDDNRSGGDGAEVSRSSGDRTDSGVRSGSDFSKGSRNGSQFSGQINQSLDGGNEGYEVINGGKPSVGEKQPQPRVRRNGFTGWNDLSDRVADISRSSPLDTSHVLTSAHRAKLDAWKVQSDALKSPHYRLTLKSRVDGIPSFNLGKGRGEGGLEQVYTADDVASRIPYLSAKNLAGMDIYLTPIDPDHHYLVVDDMTPVSLSSMKREGYHPALIQQSSQGNLQAILKVPRVESKFEQRAANELVVALNQLYGDQKFSGAIHPFRMAGFSNKKPGRDNAFTVIKEAAGVVCKKASEVLAGIRKSFDNLMPEIRVRGGVSANIISAGASAFSKARNMIRGLAIRNGWPVDESRLDFRAARLLSEDGCTPSEVAAMIVFESPDLSNRHRDPADYARRTAENAAAQGPQGPKRTNGGGGREP